MSKTKRILAFVLAAVLAVVVLSGCKSIAQKVFGSSNEVQEDDTTAKYATARANGALNIVFNGIWSRQTEYFTVPSGLLSIYGCGTTDGGAQKFKVSLWKKVDGGAQYVDNTTFYFTADGQNYHCDIDNLDPNASYRVTISYDSSRYYLYGLMKVEGIG